MRKADRLRRWLEQCQPDLKGNPDRLQIYMEDGSIVTRRGPNHAFEYHYTLNVFLQGFTGAPEEVVVPLLAWIEREQPELLQRADNQPFSFEADILDGNSTDILFKIELTDPVIATRRATGGGFDITYPDPPQAEDDGFGAPFRQGYGWTELLAGKADT